MSAESAAPMAAPVCEHYWAWVKPAGTSRSARICQLCHQPDPKWLDHTTEVDLGHGAGCLDCEFADTRPIPPEEPCRCAAASRGAKPDSETT